MATFEQNDDSVVVVIGSGAGGGTVANELTQAGVNVVLLEAGGHLTNEDYVNNEWEAFNQMAWLDPRTTTGSWRIARDFPNLPAWIVKAVGGTTTHWSGATPRFNAHEFAIRKHYGRIEGANLLDWPITLDDLAPYYTQAENNIGSTHRGAVHGEALFRLGLHRCAYRRMTRHEEPEVALVEHQEIAVVDSRYVGHAQTAGQERHFAEKGSRG